MVGLIHYWYLTNNLASVEMCVIVISDCVVLGEACLVEVGQGIHQLRGEATPCPPCGGKVKMQLCDAESSSYLLHQSFLLSSLSRCFFTVKYFLCSHSDFSLILCFLSISVSVAICVS